MHLCLSNLCLYLTKIAMRNQNQVPVNTPLAYLLWLLCLFGLCGGQRFYTGHYISGTLYLFTLGFGYIGQMIDLALIPGMVKSRNLYLMSNCHCSQVTLDIGKIPHNPQPNVKSPTVKQTKINKMLRVAKNHRGTVSVAQLALETGLERRELQKLLQDCEKFGYAHITNDIETGSIRYKFDI